MVLQMGADGFQGDLCSRIYGVAVYPGGDRRKRDGFQCMCFSERQALLIRAAQQLSFMVRAVAVDRADGVDDIACRQTTASGHDGRASRARADFAAGGHDGRTACLVNGTIHAATASQTGICRIHDCVHWITGDIAATQNNYTMVDRQFHAYSPSVGGIVNVCA